MDQIEWSENKPASEGYWLYWEGFDPILVKTKYENGILTMTGHPNTYLYPVSVMPGWWIGPIKNPRTFVDKKAVLKP